MSARLKFEKIKDQEMQIIVGIIGFAFITEEDEIIIERELRQAQKSAMMQGASILDVTNALILKIFLLCGHIQQSKIDDLTKLVENKPYNLRMYESIVSSQVDNSDDLRFVCNQMAKLYKKIDCGCTDNARVCKSDLDSKMTDRYKSDKLSGCCGSSDVLIQNKKTKNYFLIGFNYGH